MPTTKPRLSARDTEPMSNFLNYAPQHTRDTWMKEGLLVSSHIRLQGMKYVEYHKKFLRRCRINSGIRTYHTWDRPLWRAHVADDYGVKFELPDFPGWHSMAKNPMPHLLKAVEAWHDYMTAIGLESALVLVA